MKARFLKKCTCEDNGYVKLQKTETKDKLRYFELTVNCRECGKAYKEITPKGKFRGEVIFTDAKPEKKKELKEVMYKDKDVVISVDSAVPEKDRVVVVDPDKESFGKRMARLRREKKEKKNLSGVTFDKDRN